MINLLGIVGAALLSMCCLPQTLKTVRTRRADDISWGFLWMWFIGELCLIGYVSAKTPIDWIFMGNYIVNIILLIPILVVKWIKR